MTAWSPSSRTRSKAPSTPTARAEVVRLPLAHHGDPLDVLRKIRHRSRPIALIGSGWRSGDVVTCEPTRVLESHEDPFHTPDDGSDGWWMGSWGYPLLHRVEPVPPARPHRHPAPPAVVAYYPHRLVRRAGRWWVEGTGDEHELRAWAADLLGAPLSPSGFTVGTFESVWSFTEYQRAFDRVAEHIRRGDVYQVNLATALEATFEGDPVDLFCSAVRAVRPAYGAYVGWLDGAVASLSPELFLRREGDRIMTSPVKGTAARGESEAADAALRAGLENSRKNTAENVMIVDLMRNDLARVCRPGSVVAGAMRVEKHAVWHLVTDVSGRLGEGLGHREVFRATFPPGSITGAPKVAAMGLINELEAAQRQAYTGCIGSLSRRRAELNVAIRSFELGADRVRLQVGGGITARSDAVEEWNECAVKAAPLLRSIGARTSMVSMTSTEPRTSCAGIDPPMPTSSVIRRRSCAYSPASAAGARVLCIDNLDSFVYNLVDDVRQLGATVEVVRNTALDVADLALHFRRGDYTHLLVSPGPGAPEDAGICVEAVRVVGAEHPVLGVCLGHQAIIVAYGGTVGRAASIVHGSASPVTHDGTGLWSGAPSPLTLGRYHSLSSHQLPEPLRRTGWTDDGTVMGVAHRRYPVWGIQGHPESVLSQAGPRLIANFLSQPATPTG